MKILASTVLGLCCALLLATAAAAATPATKTSPVNAMSVEDIPDQDRMNGFALKDYANFQKEWPLVTVRFRKDTGELRFTYANDLAYAALKNGATEYPDGAVFAKIGIITEEDPAFTSSAVPSGARRFQLMVHDSKKFPETHGWGFALFDARAKASGKDVALRSAACDACHALVPERGYVFSQVMKLDVADTIPVAPVAKDDPARVHFETVTTDKLPKALASRLPKEVKQVRLLRGELEKHIFRGTIDEIRPTLALEAQRTDMPAALVSEDGTLFSLVQRDIKMPTCLDGKSLHMTGFYTLGSLPGKPSNTVNAESCEAPLKK